MIWKPLSVVNGTRSGSDEGANVFIYLPFSDSGLSSDSRYQAAGYYSERASSPALTLSVDDANRNNRRGPKRVTRTEFEIDNSSPI